MPISALALILATADTKVVHKSANESRKGKYELSLNWVVLSPADPCNTLANELVSQAVIRYADEFKKGAMEPGYQAVAPWEHRVGCTVSWAKPGLVSILVDTYDYSGGAHPNSYTDTVNVAVIQGKAKQLRLADILAEGARESDILDVIVLPRVDAQRRARIQEGVDILPEETSQKFLISRYGLAFPFDKYSLGSYAEGEYMVKVAWKDMKGLINPKIIPFAVP